MSELTPDAANGERMIGVAQAVHPPLFRVRPTLVLSSMLLLLAFTLLPNSGCSSKSAPSGKSASPRLHLVAALYGKYVSAHRGEMPADEQEFVTYIDANERELLQRYGLRSGQDLFTEAAGRPRLIVLYRDQRHRLPTEFVVIEEEKVSSEGVKGQKVDTRTSRSNWVAADVLGIGQEISADEANRVLADAAAAANKSPESAPETKNAADKEKNKKTSQRPMRPVRPQLARAG